MGKSNPARRLLAILGCCLGIAACSTVDFTAPKDVSVALAPSVTSETALGRYASEQMLGQNPQQSGFHLLPDAIDALSLRLLLADKAQRTLDAQYYLVKADTAGLAFMHALLKAADRGVQVRLLIDDMFTSGHDIGLAALDHHPNIAIRIFNPFAQRGIRAFDGWDFGRINRRMHNKSFTVDNQLTILGGRNIASEYFGARKDARFGDLDVLALGPIVPEVSASFDAYWNHERAAPLPLFARMPDDPEAALVKVRERLEAARGEAEQDTKLYADAVRARVQRYLAGGKRLFTFADYTLAVDSPDKSFRKLAATAPSIKTTLLQSLATAEKEVILISPYFVPGEIGVKTLAEAQARGIQVTVVTNSLAANNQFTVHAGYAPRRKALLKAGVRLFEVRPDAQFSGQDLVAASSAKSTLHTKAFVVDDREMFIGSFNFDPRSANINTEVGVVIRSPELAAQAFQPVENWLRERTWQLVLSDDKQLRWRGLGPAGEMQEWTQEPGTSWWDRFVVGFVGLLPIDSQL
ncbi:MAG: phospholipase D family protein [Congregibacter sp.]